MTNNVKNSDHSFRPKENNTVYESDNSIDLKLVGYLSPIIEKISKGVDINYLGLSSLHLFLDLKYGDINKFFDKISKIITPNPNISTEQKQQFEKFKENTLKPHCQQCKELIEYLASNSNQAQILFSQEYLNKQKSEIEKNLSQTITIEPETLSINVFCNKNGFNLFLGNTLKENPETTGIQPCIFPHIAPNFRKHLIIIKSNQPGQFPDYDKKDIESTTLRHEEQHVMNKLFYSDKTITNIIDKNLEVFKNPQRRNQEIFNIVNQITNAYLSFLLQEEIICFMIANNKSLPDLLNKFINAANTQGSYLGQETDQTLLETIILEHLNKNHIKNNSLKTSIKNYITKSLYLSYEKYKYRDENKEGFSIIKFSENPLIYAKNLPIIYQNIIFSFSHLAKKGYNEKLRIFFNPQQTLEIADKKDKEENNILLLSPLIGHRIGEWPRIARTAPKIN